MPHIEKLVVRGIRSFSPSTHNAVEFNHPLTLIVGPNGSGKTTIIESLKYATTGNLPPNTKGGAFIYDPKLYREVETKAQIKLKFYNTRSQLMVCTRSLQLTQKKNRVEQKTLESVLWTINEKGEQVSISGRCAEIDREMPHHLGVSSAVLENVIFCHQEESNWPLSEPGTVKKKMDDIFESTKYTKMLAGLKALKREQSNEVKLKKQALEFFYQQKLRKDGLDNKIRESNVSMQGIEEKISMLDIECGKYLEEKEKAQEKCKLLEQCSKKMLETQIEIHGIKKYIEDFPYPLIPSDEAKDLWSADIDLIRGDIESLKEKAGRQQRLLDEKVKERERYLSTKSDYAKYEFQLSDEKKRLCEVVNAYKDQLVEYGEFLRKYGTQEASLEPENHLNCKDIEGLEIGAKNAPSLESVDITKLEVEADRILRRIEEEEVEQDRTKEALEGSIQELSAKINRNDLEIEYIRGSMERIEGSNILPEDEDGVLMDLKQLETGTTSHSIQRCREEILGRRKEIERLLTLVGEKSGDKRAEDIKSTISSRYPEFMEGERVNVQHLDSEHKKAVADLKIARMALEEHNKKQSYSLLRERDIKVCFYKDKIREQLEKIRRLAHGSEAGCMEELYSEDNLQDLYKKLDSLKGDLASSLNALKMYKNLQKLGIKHSDCPLCKKPFFGREKSDFINRIDKVVEKIPEIVKEVEEKKEVLSKEISRIEDLDTKKSERNRETEKLNEYIFEARKVVEFEDLEAFLENKGSGPALCEKKSGEEDLVNKEKYLSMIEEVFSLAAELKAIENEVSKNNNEVENLNLELKGLEDELGGLEKKKSDESLMLQEVQRKLQSIAEYKERKKKEEKNVILESKIGEVSKNSEDLLSLLDSYRGQLEKISRSKVDGQEKLKRAWKEKFVIFQAFSSLKDEYRSRSLYIKELEDKLRTGIGACQVTAEDIDVLRSKTTCIWEKYYKEYERFNEINSKLKVLEENVKLKQHKERLKKLEEEYDSGPARDLESTRIALNKIEESFQKAQNRRSVLIGQKTQLFESRKQYETELETSFKDAEKNYTSTFAELKVMEVALSDIDNGVLAIDKSIVEFHSRMLEEINSVLKDLWSSTYKGNDIEYIEIQADASDTKSYNYKINMVKNGCELDMRSRSSAGQKVIASILIRLALSEAFGSSCSLLTLDEPTTNLDQENIESLAQTLSSLIERRKGNDLFQLVIITHDEQFVKLLCRDNCDEYYKLRRNGRGDSVIEKHTT